MLSWLLFSGELSECWQRVKSALNESYPVCPTRLSVLSGLVPLLPSCSSAADDSGGAVTQSAAVADLCLTCAQSLIGSHSGDTDVSHIISTMLQVLVIVSHFDDFIRAMVPSVL